MQFAQKGLRKFSIEEIEKSKPENPIQAKMQQRRLQKS